MSHAHEIVSHGHEIVSHGHEIQSRTHKIVSCPHEFESCAHKFVSCAHEFVSCAYDFVEFAVVFLWPACPELRCLPIRHREKIVDDYLKGVVDVAHFSSPSHIARIRAEIEKKKRKGEMK